MKGLKVISKLLTPALVLCFANWVGAQEQRLTSHQKEMVSPIHQYWSPLDTLSYGLAVSSRSSLFQSSLPKMPFFCHIEHNLAKTSGFPVKFRLGDVNYVDKLENK